MHVLSFIACCPIHIQVFISDVALAVVSGILWRAGQSFGWGWLSSVYIIPYLVVNHWLVSLRPLYCKLC